MKFTLTFPIIPFRFSLEVDRYLSVSLRLTLGRMRKSPRAIRAARNAIRVPTMPNLDLDL